MYDMRISISQANEAVKSLMGDWERAEAGGILQGKRESTILWVMDSIPRSLKAEGVGNMAFPVGNEIQNGCA